MIWAPDGTLLAQSRQLALLMPRRAMRLGWSRMADYTAKRINDMEAGFGGGFVKARAELGVTAFGFQVIQLPPDYGDYPEHDHAETGQEEVYLALAGSGWMDIEGERVDLDAETFVRVGPGDQAQGLRRDRRACACSSIGGCPGEAYKPSEMTELTAA